MECHIISTDNWLATILRWFVWKSDIQGFRSYQVHNYKFKLKPMLKSLAPLLHGEVIIAIATEIWLDVPQVCSGLINTSL